MIPTTEKAKRIKDILMSNSGKIFSVTWVKKDGAERTIACQQGFFKGHTGVDTTAHIEKYLNVRTMKGEFKKINCETVKRFKCGDTELSFNG